MRYWYAFTPLVIVGTVVLLSLPWLGLIALLIVALVALAALAWAIIFVPFKLSQAIGRRWHGRSSASPRAAAALSPANSGVRATGSVPTGAAASLSARLPKGTGDMSTVTAEPSGMSHALFVIPRGRGDGFQASIRGDILDLADPGSSHALAPTPDDLFIVSIASGLAWAARRCLRASGLPDDVSVSATWRTHEDPPSLADIDLTVAVSRAAEAVSAALAAAFASSRGGRSLANPVVHISFEGVDR